jgi:hypothetical protein
MKPRFTYQNATAVAMIHCGPDGATFGVFQTRVRIRESNFGDWSWNAHRATRVGTITIPRGDACPTYREMAERFETAEYPAWRR